MEAKALRNMISFTPLLTPKRGRGIRNIVRALTAYADFAQQWANPLGGKSPSGFFLLGMAGSFDAFSIHERARERTPRLPGNYLERLSCRQASESTSNKREQ